MTDIPSHFMVSEADGKLYDTRIADWPTNPLRPNYRVHHREIKNIADLKASLRAGGHTSIGCYPLFFITKDGGALSFNTVKNEFANILRSWDYDPSWRIVGCDVNYENGDLYDDHTGAKIEAAYVD